ncbi:MAG: S9 family peptidase [Patescibacteria group bacterium]
MIKSKKYTINDFLEVKSAWNPSFNPSASKIAYLSNVTGIAQIYLIPRTGGEAIQLTNSDDPVSFALFSPTQDVILFEKSEGGNEQNQLYLINPDSKEITPLTNNKEARHDFGSWSHDGKFISFSSTERNGKDFDIYVMDIENKEKQCVYQEGGWCRAGSFSPKRTYLSIRKNYSNMNSDTYLYNLRSGELEHLTPHTEPTFQGTPRWFPDESAFLITMDQDREFIGISKYSFEKKKFEYVFTQDWDVCGLAMQKSGKFLATIINEDGYSKLIIQNPHNLEVLPYDLPKGEINGVRFSSDANFAIFSMVDSCRTRDIWILDTQSKKYTQVTQSPQGVPSEVMVEPELIRYKSFDGLIIPAFIYKPNNLDGKKKVPAVINIHGGPEGQHQPGYAPITQYLVNNGYAVVAPNVRGSSGYGKTYLTLDDVEKRMDSVKDIVALREHLKTIPYIDTSKLILMGGSYGGFMVLAGLAFYPDLWAAGVDTVGIANWVTFLENTAPYRRALREAEYGSLEKDREFLKSVSPINSVEKIKAPLFIIHGANDPRVPLSEAEQMVTKLRELGREVEILIYTDEGHGLSKLKNRLDAYPKVVTFLDKIINN